LILSLTLATLAFVSASTARPTTEPTRLAQDAFAPVVIPSAAPSAGGSEADAVRPVTPAATAPPDPIVDFSTAQRSLDPRPNVDIAAQAGIEVKPTPTPTPRPTPKPKPAVRTSRPAGTHVSKPARRAPRTAPAPTRTGHSVSGPASWYCKTGTSACTHGYPGGMYAAAGPALRVGAWRGRVVQVCGAGGCISVKLIDWCGCPNGRVMDLYSDAYRRLSPLSTGTQRVRVSW
jgi:rare lipoprotein A (peptidoglycan hydrolase)